MRILIEAVLSAAISISGLCGAEPYLIPASLPRPLDTDSAAVSDTADECPGVPDSPDACDAALSDALRDITAPAAAARENRLGQADGTAANTDVTAGQSVAANESGAANESSAANESGADKASDDAANPYGDSADCGDADGGTDGTADVAADGTAHASTDVYGRYSRAEYLGYTDDSPIYVYDHSTGCTITTTLGEYVEGVCRAEMPRYFETEALRAQAIAARSYAVYKLIQGPPDAEHGRACVCNEPAHCCAYRSAEGEYTDEATEAAADTRNIIVTYDGMSICAAWHARSAGHTRSAVDVWGGNAPYLVSVPTEEDSAACLGHGVGMSQYGALAMAERGLTAEEILMHYYTGCELSLLG